MKHFIVLLYWLLLFSSRQVRSLGMHSECLDYNSPEHSPTGAHLSLFGCHGQGGNQVGQTFHTFFILSFSLAQVHIFSLVTISQPLLAQWEMYLEMSTLSANP